MSFIVRRVRHPCESGDKYPDAVWVVDHGALPSVHGVSDVCGAFWREALVSGRAWPGNTFFPVSSDYDEKICRTQQTAENRGEKRTRQKGKTLIYVKGYKNRM